MNTSLPAIQQRLPQGTRLIWLLALLLVAGTALLYSPAVKNGFVNFDDPDYVTRNTAVLQGLSWQNVVWAFGTDNPAANWHPLTWISHMLDVQWFGKNPAGHHLTNVLFFAADVLLLFLFLVSATGKVLRSAAVAALFAAHPLNVETVAWIAERKSVLSIFFMLLALLSYTRYARNPSYSRYVLVFVCFALALMAKVMVIALPVGMLLLDYWPLQRYEGADREGTAEAFFKRFGHLFLEKIPLFALSAAAGWMTMHVQRRQGAVGGSMPLVWRVKNAAFSYVAYVGQIVWPTKLAVFYPHPENSLAWGAVIACAIALLTITILVVKAKDRKYLVVGWLWYLGFLFPMIGLVQSGRQGMADRYACLSLIGVFVALVWLGADYAARLHLQHATSAVVFVALLLPCIYLTRVQIGYWKNSYTLFGHTLEVTHNNGMAENNFGAALVEMGEAPRALPHFEAAVRMIPELASAHYNLGRVLQSQNQLEEAARQYQMSIATSTDRGEIAQAHNNLGALYLQSKNLGAAKQEFSAAIALNPGEANSYIGRGMIEQQGWDFEAAAADFSRAAHLVPSPLAYFWLGRALESKGDLTHAADAYQRALQLAPDLADARNRLASLQGQASK